MDIYTFIRLPPLLFIASIRQCGCIGWMKHNPPPPIYLLEYVDRHRQAVISTEIFLIDSECRFVHTDVCLNPHITLVNCINVYQNRMHIYASMINKFSSCPFFFFFRNNNLSVINYTVIYKRTFNPK